MNRLHLETLTDREEIDGSRKGLELISCGTACYVTKIFQCSLRGTLYHEASAGIVLNIKYLQESF